MKFRIGDKVEVKKIRATCNPSFPNCKYAKGTITNTYSRDKYSDYEVKFDRGTSKCSSECTLSEDCLITLVPNRELI
jgi:hypothetical protein